MKKKYALQTLCLFIAWLLLQNFNVYPAANREGSYKIKKIVLDAGHGGKDPGCIGAGSREKHNALAIVLRLGERIKETYPDIQVIYTRDKDVFVELRERAAIANRNRADLFISVHCNSIPVPSVTGTETYVMGLHTAQHNLEVAKRENASIFLEDNYEKHYDGYDPNSPEAHILSAVWQSAYLEQSILFASFVQKFAKNIAGRDDKGVKQAGFLVLRETAMPSVLVESGYMTNRREENFLASEAGQDAMANAIFEAFRQYKARMEGLPAPEPLAYRPPAKPVSLEQEPAEKPVVQKLPAENRPVFKKNQPAKPAPTPAAAQNCRILLCSWPTRLDMTSGQFALLSDLREEFDGGKYHYYVGQFITRPEAERMLPELHNLGFRTAAIIIAQADKNN